MRHFCESNVCPQCDSQLGTNPKDLVRTDRTLQSIVDKVFPQFAQSNEQAKEASKRPASPTGESRPAKNARQAPLGVESPEEISFSLQEETLALPLAAEYGTKLEKPFLRTKAQLTVAHLKKYLNRKMSLNADAEVDILCRANVMPTEITLDQIVKEHWKHAEDLVLNYRVRARALEPAAGDGDGSGVGVAGDDAASAT